MKKSALSLSCVAAISTIVSACFGLFYSFGGLQKTVLNIYGSSVVLFGDGIYANDSLLKAGATKGTDIVMIAVSLLLLALIFPLRNKKSSAFLQCGCLSLILYATTCLIMGNSFNRLFPLYLLQFGSVLFAFVLSLSALLKAKHFTSVTYQKKLIGTAVFLAIGGSSVLVWLTFIIPAVLTGVPFETIDVYTTEPIFALDLAILMPIFWFCAVMLWSKKEIGYHLAPVLLTLLTGVGACVIVQSVFQTQMGIEIEIRQILGLVVSFAVLGSVALVLNIRLLKCVNKV
jgi:hypothetical protein